MSSQSTYRILKDLYDIRLLLLRIFLASFIVAIVISLFLSRTISHRIKILSREAEGIKTGKGKIRGTFTPLKLNDEIGFLSRSLKDLTDRLDKHIQFIDSLSRDISHEFKNPLSVIRSANEMIGSTEGVQQERFIELINQNTKRMESLLNGVEEISRLDSHMDKEEKNSIDINTLLQGLLVGFELQYPAFNWILNSKKENLSVWASAERLGQVFVNLYENASSFTLPGGKIETTVKRTGLFVEIEIFNEGSSIAEGDLEKIYNRFFTSRENRGDNHHGLGLSIVKTIVESYGGRIIGNNISGGVSFTISLPLLR